MKTVKKVIGWAMFIFGVLGILASIGKAQDIGYYVVTLFFVIVGGYLVFGEKIKRNIRDKHPEYEERQSEKALAKKEKMLAKQEAKALKNKITVNTLSGESFYADDKDDILENISKEVDFSTIGDKKFFLVDDINQEMALLQYKEAIIFNYRDILNYEYKENGEKIIGGKKLATLAGGLTFGVLGAMVGSSGNKKIKEKVDSMEVVINLNSLNDANLKMEFLPSKVKRDSTMYKIYLEQANQVIHALNYATNKIK